MATVVRLKYKYKSTKMQKSYKKELHFMYNIIGFSVTIESFLSNY